MSGSEQRDDTGLKARMRDRQALTGAFVPAPSPELVEIAAHAGYDFVVLDAEHGPGFRRHHHMIRAAQAVGVPVLVRVPTASKEFIGRVLDSGADGILVPQVSSVEEARAAVSQALYPPAGTRRCVRARAYGYTRHWKRLGRAGPRPGQGRGGRHAGNAPGHRTGPRHIRNPGRGLRPVGNG